MKSAKAGKSRDTLPVTSGTMMVSPDYNNLNFLKYRNTIKTGPGDIAGDIEMVWNLRVEEYYGITDQLAKKAIGLRPTERIRLVEAILYSLDKPDPDIEKSWIAEAEARYEAYKRGELEAIEWDEIRKSHKIRSSR
jgi:putative addiction module component (TIGR02574 family)